MLFRALVVGLLAACLIQLCRHHVEVRVHRDGTLVHPATPMTLEQPLTVLDVSGAVPAKDQIGLVSLGPDEQIVSLEDHGDAYKDIEVRGKRGRRRILLLVH